jgi:SAM-dependent methyltransferase
MKATSSNSGSAISQIGRPSPFELDLPWHDYNFSQRLYDLNHDWGIPTEKEINFINRFVTKRPARILDLACGAGRHALGLSASGHKVVGIDIGGYPIKIARGLAEERRLAVDFIQRDIREIGYNSEFDMAFILCGQMGHFSPKDSELIFGKIAHALVAGGIFIVHLNSFSEEDKREYTGWYRENKPLYLANPSLVHREQYYFAKERVKLLRDFVIDSVSFDYRLFSISEKEYSKEEIVTLGKKSGLILKASSGGYDDEPLELSSTNRVFVFGRK